MDFLVIFLALQQELFLLLMKKVPASLPKSIPVALGWRAVVAVPDARIHKNFLGSVVYGTSGATTFFK